MNLKPRLSASASCTPLQDGWRFTIPSGPASRYRLSQLDDHAHVSRKKYAWQPPLALSLRARASDASMPGTWGFGLWNDPFGFSFGIASNFFTLPALPNAVWFFYGSGKNYLSFRDDKPVQGFHAQSFRSPGFHPLLISAALSLPFSRRATRRILSRIIAEDSASLNMDVTQWHSYRLGWEQGRTSFFVDEKIVLETPVSPRAPLGLILWIDNQYAAFTPEGKLGWGLEANPKSEWLEIESLIMK